MPRLKKPEFRQRSLRACVSCRKRKEKCDGREPCGGCRKRGIYCDFAVAKSSPYHTRNVSNSDSHVEKKTPLGDEDSERRRRSFTGSRSLLPNRSDQDIDAVNKDKLPDGLSETPVPKSARLLTDFRGKWIYVGDSASISFAQNVRHIVSAKLGECNFTSDVFHHHFLEQFPSPLPQEDVQSSINELQAPFAPSYEEAKTLFNRFLASTSGLLDIFDVAEVEVKFSTWISGGLPLEEPSASQYYLILAIGAQSHNDGGYDTIAEHYYSFARRMIPNASAEEPSIHIIQCYMLISRYLFGGCRRNAAYMTFGVAVRAGYALGMNRADLYRFFPESERQSRERLWRTLRVMDTFLSASLGRPPATSDHEYRPAPGDQNLTNKDVTENDISIAIARLCPIFEKIQLGVYQNQGVSTKVANEISQRFRDWTSMLPQLPEESQERPLSMTMIIGSAHLLGAYHWSIILLTRPFLTFAISMGNQSSHRGGSSRKPGGISPTVAAFANACVDSAIRALEITVDLLKYPWLPRRMPFMLNYIFNAAIAIGAAYFGDYDLRLPLDKSMDSAEKLLGYMRVHDPQAGRYSQILDYLKSAVVSYVDQRGRMSLQEHQKLTTSLFGEVGTTYVRADVENSTRETGSDRRGGKHREAADGPPPFSLHKEPSQSFSQSRAIFAHEEYQTNFVDGGPTRYHLDAERGDSAKAAGGEQDTSAPDFMTPDVLDSDLALYPEVIPTFSLFDDMDSDFFGNFTIPPYPPESIDE